MMVIELKVKGDHDEVYTISLEGDQPRCSCPAFYWGVESKGDAYPGCKHMRFVVDAMRHTAAATAGLHLVS